MGDDTGLAFAESLKRNCTLHSINLHAAHMSDATGIAVATALRGNGTLQSLELGIGAGFETSIAFAGLLKENSALVSLRLSPIRGEQDENSEMVHVVEAEIAEAIRRNQELPSQWRAVALVAQHASSREARAVMTVLTEAVFKRLVFSFFLPPAAARRMDVDPGLPWWLDV